MPHAVFFTKEGHAIHGTNEVKRLGTPASHGCVRLSPQNAATLYALVKENGLENTQVILVDLTPGGESKVASGCSPSLATATNPLFNASVVVAFSGACLAADRDPGWGQVAFLRR